MKRTGRSSGARRSGNVASAARRGSAGGAAARLAGPQRTCVACRSVRSKGDLVRIVRTPGGELAVDPRGRLAGRGAYCDPDPACLERGLREGAIARALETAIDIDTAARLARELNAVAQDKPRRVAPPEPENRTEKRTT